jgi:ribosome-associated translation inhibitor RaiA
VQLAISFREIPASPALEDRARQWAEKLATTFPRIQRCEVSIEHANRRHRHGPRFRVRIHLDVPGRDIDVSRDQGDHEDAHVAVVDAFRAARRKLVDHARTMRGDVKRHTQPA